MESLRENRLLMYSILASSGVVLCLALNLIPDLQSAFQIIDFPDDVSIIDMTVNDKANIENTFLLVPQNSDFCIAR